MSSFRTDGRPRKKPRISKATAVARAKRVVLGDKALELRLKGYSTLQIAKELGCSVSHAHNTMQKLLASIPVENVKELREAEDQKLRASEARLLEMQAVYLELALAGDYRAAEIVHANEARLVSIRQTRAKLLGANAPELVDVEHRQADKPVDARAVLTQMFGDQARVETVPTAEKTAN